MPSGSRDGHSMSVLSRVCWLGVVPTDVFDSICFNVVLPLYDEMFFMGTHGAHRVISLTMVIFLDA